MLGAPATVMLACLIPAMLAAVFWLIAGFALRGDSTARAAAALIGPSVATLTVLLGWCMVGATPGPDTEEARRWTVVLVVVSFIASCFAVFPAIPIWWLLERQLGGRVR